mmetsp:Transcript_15054/g.27350  ORF Transcript_15054/g.27350 Transcript_15054/m.27350 type:complete len:191 (+) Transcript_15054:130-702(+)
MEKLTKNNNKHSKMNVMMNSNGNYGDEGDQCKDVLAVAPSVPRPISSSMNRRKLLLALPPSTNIPAAFNEMHQSKVNLPSMMISDVVPQILSFCDARTLSRASCVCRSWSIMANANELWTQLCKEIFGVSPSQLKPSPDPTRILYVMSHLKLRETLCLGGVAGGWGRGNNNIQVISASTFRSFNLLRTND